MNIAEFAAGIKKPVPVVSGEEYCIAASGLDHGHIGGMVSGLHDAGARLLYVYDSVRSRAEAMAQRYGAKVVDSMEEIYADRRVKMVCSAAIPARRGPLGCEVMRHGMDFFADKAPFTTIEQLEEAKRTEKETGQRYFVYYSERLHNESAIMAGYLIREGVIGKVVNIIGTGPHRISLPTREPWFFTRKDYGGILTDIGSHQAEQFLFYTGSDEAKVVSSAVGNFKFTEYPELDDFGEMLLESSAGASGYHRVDWYTPDGLGSWGDGRCFIEGTEGFIELRKNIDITVSKRPNRLLLVNGEGEFSFDCTGATGFPFFGEIILDSLEKTERAMTSHHIFKAAELALTAQKNAVERTGRDKIYL